MLKQIATLLVALPLTAITAQEGIKEPSPAITISSTADIKVSPDRATINISVQTKHETAAGAATENAKKQTSVIAALKAMGLKDDQISTVNYNVSPSYRYEQNRDPILTGYTVTNTIVAEVRDIKQVGPVIDAALKNGSNMISSLDFYASNTDDARQKAIAQAVAMAKAEAVIAAKAAGGSIGTLLELNVNSDRPMPRPVPMYAKAAGMESADASTPINPGDQTVSVTVYTRWKYNESK